MECEICFAKTSTISCLKCNISACKKCWKTHLLALVSDPKCLNCDAVISDEFIKNNFPNAFLTDITKAKGQWLIKFHEAILPETYEILCNYKNDEEKYMFCKTCLQIKRKIVHDDDVIIIIKCSRCRVPLSKLPLCFGNPPSYYPSYLNNNVIVEKPKKTFTFTHCPIKNCDGFVFDSKCGECNSVICKKCNTEKKENHECIEEDLESVKEIKNSSSNCPGCWVPISKINGCNQMWCTKCRTAFDYRSGEIIKKHFHNPHYFDYLRTGGVAVENTENITDCIVIEKRFQGDFLQKIRHFEHVMIPRLTSRIITREKIEEKSLQYFDKKISKQKWESYVSRAIKNNMVQDALIGICRTYAIGGKSLLSRKCTEDEIAIFDTVIESLHNREMKKYSSKVCFKKLI
jgi:hypothetical protein